MMEKKLNIQSAFIGLLTLCIGIIGFFGQRTLGQIEGTQQRMSDTMVPRHEMDLQIQQLKADVVRIASEELDLRVKVVQCEVGLARLNKP